MATVTQDLNVGQCLFSLHSVPDQIAADHKSGTASSTEAMNKDRPALSDRVVDLVENLDHAASRGNAHVFDRKPVERELSPGSAQDVLHLAFVARDELAQESHFVLFHEADDMLDVDVHEAHDIAPDFVGVAPAWVSPCKQASRNNPVGIIEREWRIAPRVELRHTHGLSLVNRFKGGA